MAYTEHTPIKPERIAATAAAALEDALIVPALFRRETLDQFKGAKDDTINVKVEGVLPYRTYGWRNNRSTAIQFDVYTERKVAISFGGDLYSAVQLTDEQNLMDPVGWDKLVVKQTDALSRGLEYEAVDQLIAAPYEVVVTLDEADVRGSLTKLKGVFDRLKVSGPRRLILGTDIEAAILNDDRIVLSQNTSEEIAATALREAYVGRVAGFNLVTALELPTDEAVAMVDSAFIMVTGAPTVPQSVKHGASASAGGVSVRWITDYDADHMVDRSVVNLYKGFRSVNDPLVARDASTPGQGVVSDANHFVRAIKVELGAAYSVEVGNAELTEFTGIESTDGLSDGA